MFNFICIPITFNIHQNYSKVCFLTKKISYYNLNTPNINCISNFLLENPVFNGFKIIGGQNKFPITFCSNSVCNKTLKAIDSIPTHMNI